MGIFARGEPKNIETIWEYCGVWHKPWTWFSWKRVTLIRDWKLIEFSFVSNPINKHCRIKK